MTALARERALAKIARLARQPRDLVSFWQESTDVLRASIPYYWTPCWYTLDPASLLITSHFHDGLPELPAEWLVNEYYGDDVNKLVDVARSPLGISTLHEATNGDPSRSPRWHQNRNLGGDQELIARLRSRSGEVWGALGLYREPGSRSSTNLTSNSCWRSRRTWPRERGGHSWWARPPIRRDLIRRGWSS
jgi:hypothetical protein